MKGTDIRDENWRSLRGHVGARLHLVHAALLAHGPLTTAELAARMGKSVLSVRPRVTDLVTFGLARCVGRNGRDGVYRAVNWHDAAEAWERRHSGAAVQMLLRIEG